MLAVIRSAALLRSNYPPSLLITSINYETGATPDGFRTLEKGPRAKGQGPRTKDQRVRILNHLLLQRVRTHARCMCSHPCSINPNQASTPLMPAFQTALVRCGRPTRHTFACRVSVLIAPGLTPCAHSPHSGPHSIGGSQAHMYEVLMLLIPHNCRQ